MSYCKCGTLVGNNFASKIPKVFKVTAKCGCEETREQMNLMGPDECEANMSALIELIANRAKGYMIPKAISRPNIKAKLEEAIAEARCAISINTARAEKMKNEMSGVLGNRLRLQQGEQGLPPQDGNLPR
jgi:hypothetical protein